MSDKTRGVLLLISGGIFMFLGILDGGWMGLFLMVMSLIILLMAAKLSYRAMVRPREDKPPVEQGRKK